MQFFKKLSDWIAKVSMVLSSLFMFIVFAIIVVQVILRYVFNTGIMFSDELSRYMTIWSVMLAGNVLLKEDLLIKVDFLDNMWPKKFLAIREVFYQGVTLILLGFLIYEGSKQAIDGIQVKLISMGLSWFWPYLAIPLGSALMFYQALYSIIQHYSRKLRKEESN